VRLAVLVSGSGTILSAIIDAGLPVDLVLADRPCAGLEIARSHGIAAELVGREAYGGFGSDFDRDGYSATVAATLVAHQIDLVAMAGFGTLLTEPVHRAFPGRILNTHPSLLPAFPGWHAVRDALAAGATETGCTVHIAVLEMDAGPILAQEKVQIVFRDTEESLHERIKVVERSLYPATIAWALHELEAGREIASPRSFPGEGEAGGSETAGSETGGASAQPVQNDGPGTLTRTWRSADTSWRRATAALRPWPDIMIIGAQRGGTTSMRKWLGAHPRARVFQLGEAHFFDNYYDRGERWYRAQFPTGLRRQRRVESSPYMLFHPLAPQRAARDLPPTTQFVVLLREPAERALSQYRRERSKGRERLSFADALAAEDARLRDESTKVARGELSLPHQFQSYRARGVYVEQIDRWYRAVGPDRVKVVESERLYEEESVARDLLGWLDLPVEAEPFPSLNASPEPTPDDLETLEELRGWYEPYNEKLFDLLGWRLWDD
jgi:phosphoribosylglycinamide formyltransferase-1